MKIFLIDDEKIFSENVKKKFSQYGYAIETFSSLKNLISKGSQEYCDLYIIDISLPGKDGFEVINYLRNTLQISTPIIVLSGFAGVDYKVKALNLGADDYMTKPFSSEELIARIRSIIRRKSNGSTSSCLRYKDISLDLYTGEVKKDEILLDLNKKEMLLLEFFILNVGRLIEKEELICSIWGEKKDYSTLANTLSVTLFRMKVKLGDTFSLKTRFRTGYILEK